MLELKNIKKFYGVGDFKQMALNGVSLKFNTGELVSILGPSGCGKTTLLNIIGGLDRYTSGDLIINGKSTKDFKDSDWDSYRNNSIGFVFQSYNLINHISVLDNVEMALTLSGVSSKEKKAKALEVLDKVGLKSHAHKKPNQLSGGQMQRVAIARAIANDPDIILMDEPTGALDSKTSIQVLDLVKTIASDKLVILVTHNPELAEMYSNRIIKLHDGEVIDDSKPNDTSNGNEVYNPKKTAMSFLTALKLSFNNLKTKIIRSLITTLAASIGIIGVALVLSISNGFGNEVNRLQRESLSGMPVTISEYALDIDMDTFRNRPKEELPEPGYIYPEEVIATRINKIDEKYVNFINNMDRSYYTSISYTYNTSVFNLIINNGVVTKLSASNINFAPIPDNDEYILSQFEILTGRMPENSHEVVLVTDNKQRVDQSVLNALEINEGDKIPFESVLNLQLASAKNDDYYTQIGDYYVVNNDLSQAYANGIKLKIVGILKASTDVAPLLLGNGIAYHRELADEVFAQSMTSAIVTYQKSVDFDVMTGNPFNPFRTKESALRTIGGIKIPTSIKIYTSDFEAKNRLKDYLNTYNTGLADEDKIIVTDLAAQFTNVISSLIDGISIVLIAFAGISLIVSSIMIGIITYVSVLERTKEIGILRSLGARKKDIMRVFNAETTIIGFTAGVVGVILTLIINIPLDIILTKQVEGMSNIVSLAPHHAILLVVVSMILTLISGFIPARIAAKKDPVNALRTES